MLSPRNWSLRNRLILGVLLLSSLAFTVSDVVAQNALRSFLTHQIDQNLASVSVGSLHRVNTAGIAHDENSPVTESSELTQQKNTSVLASSDVKPLQRVPTTTSVVMLDPQGNVLGAIGGDLNSTRVTDFLSDLTSEKAAAHGGKPFTIDESSGDFRILASALPSGQGTVIVAQSLDELNRTLNRLKLLFILIGLIAILLIGFASRKVISIALKPLEDVENTAQKIADGDLSARMPYAKPDTEVGRLITALNTMLARIEEAFTTRMVSEEKLRRFVADAGHELRTPLTAIRGFAELHRQGAVSGEANTRELLGRIESESKRMGSLVEDLLLLAKLDQSREMQSKPVNLTHLLTEAVESAKAAGPEHPITLNIPSDEIYILGDEQRVHQVVANLLANARAHTPAGTPVSVDISQTDDGTSIAVSDKGPGLSEADQSQIFERFFRTDPSRKRSDGEGSGLGLSIVDAVMRAHNGRVSVISKPGEGATFTLFFPLISHLNPSD